MAVLGIAAPRKWDRDNMEPRVREILDRTVRDRPNGPYRAKTADQVATILQNYFAVTEGLTQVAISDVVRMAGGASKEQFAFRLRHAGDAEGTRLILRMDPLEGITQTCRGRESQLHMAMKGVVPIAGIRSFDADGDVLGQPGMIMEFVSGVTQPTEVDKVGVTGIGSRFDDWVPKLAPQFIDAYIKVHGFDFSKADLSYFNVPRPGTTDAALWQVNWWSQLGWNALLEPVPIITLAERWLRENAPVCEKPVIVHGDLRMGNFMFEEPSGRFTAILDWELGHIGDYHEDIAWVIQKLFGVWREDGVFLVCGLMPRDEFLGLYQAQSGNVIDPVKLRYYEILNAYKCAVMDLSQAIRAATESNNHQDLVLTMLASAGAVFLAQIVLLLREA
ncbi:phosphotransferase family protein [Novosphingobium lentum]|uniref:phosphotransferase family protein n=1 Tax=Novosphingobium lentum TaxID=145287 RepID=UPI00082F54EE|nr:phosphotransferase family protein [Novosphingobium lentum]